MSLHIPRQTYADLYGPTTGDRVRLADTELIIEVEQDFTVYGDEITFGGGKVIRDGMGQSSRATRPGHGALDLVITNALIIDHWGIVKGDIGIKDGRIVKVGKAGNPDTMDGVDPELVVGSGTEVIAGENMIVTAGGIDFAYSLYFAPADQEAMSNGITTMLAAEQVQRPGQMRRPVRQVHGISRGCSNRPSTGRLILVFSVKGILSTHEPLARAVACRGLWTEIARGLGYNAGCDRYLFESG